MTEPSPPRPNLLLLAWPIVISFTMRSLFNWVDTIYAATLGTEAIAAIGLTFPLEFVMIAFWVGTSSGLTSILSRAMGAGENQKVEQALALTRKIIVVLGALFIGIALAIWFGAPLLARRYGMDPTLTRYFQIYAAVIMGGSGITAFWSIIPDSLVKAHHDTKATMIAGIWSNVVNLVLNTLFLFAFGWGIFGIALSTVLGRLGGLIYSLRAAAVHEQKRLAAPQTGSSALDPRPLRRLLGLAVPAAGAFTLMAFEGLLINGLLASSPESVAALAAYSVFHKALLFMVMPVIALTVAMLPFVGRLAGESAWPEVNRGVWQAHVASLVYLVALAPLCAFAATPIAAALSSDPVTVRHIAFGLQLCPLLCLAMTPFTLVRPVFEGLGRGGPVIVLAVIRYLVLTPPLALLGIWWAPQLGRPPFDGLLIGMLIATGVTSLGALGWLVRAIAQAAAADAAPAVPDEAPGEPPSEAGSGAANG